VTALYHSHTPTDATAGFSTQGCGASADFYKPPPSELPKLVSATPDWKQKYRDSLLEMEGEEQRWRQVEQALRRLVGRLCAAGMGVDPKLDDELIALAAANRRNATAAELEKLAESLTTTVVAVDAVSPVPTIRLPALDIPRWDLTRSAVGKVLQRLRSVGHNTAALELIAKIPSANSDSELAAILDETAELIRSHSEMLSQERFQAAALLADVTQRLEEMAGYLTEYGNETRSRYADTASVNETVMTQVRELTAEVDSATELSALRAAVTVRLEKVTEQVLQFRIRDEKRLREYAVRADRMRARISDLERETSELNAKLDQEKYGARLDPLTRLANRKSFDERFAEGMLRRSQTDSPISMLLWDLDNFKLINDTYGHRAGDRVLQTVATCLMSGVRACDFVARIGGEEFVILLTDVPFDRAMLIAEELRTSVESLRFHFRGAPVRVTVSCGATDLRPEDAPGNAFDRADRALYRAKHGGKNLCFAA
jgi:diguanylate cyclase